MKIIPIVEGYGEVDSVGILLRRLQSECGIYGFQIGRPLRRKRDELTREEGLRRSVGLARQQDGCAGILVLFDGDDDCPRDWGPRVQEWARREARDIPCEVVMAWREYEAWFLADVPHLLSGAVGHNDPERPRGAKEALAELMSLESYDEVVDQPRFTARFNMAAAHRRCRSFRRMARAFSRLAAGAGFPLTDWPPPEWSRGDR